MIERFFEFPQDLRTCPICGTRDQKPTFLLSIDGTSDGRICEAEPTHVACILERLEQFQYNRSVGIIYLRAEKRGTSPC